MKKVSITKMEVALFITLIIFGISSHYNSKVLIQKCKQKTFWFVSPFFDTKFTKIKCEVIE